MTLLALNTPKMTLLALNMELTGLPWQWRRGSHTTRYIWVVVKIMVPFWVP